MGQVPIRDRGIAQKRPFGDVDQWSKAITVLVAVATLVWGVIQFSSNQKQLAKTQFIEARKPFLERQLKLYTEATVAAATISTSNEEAKWVEATNKFWALYWGELAMVEDRRVEDAMKAFGIVLERKYTSQPERDRALKNASLNLAHACRASLADSWGVADWKRPD